MTRKVTARYRSVTCFLQYIYEKMAPRRAFMEASYSILRPQNLLMSFRQTIYKNLCNEPIYSHTFVLNLSRLSINIYMQIIEDLEMKAVITNAMQLHIEMLCIFINSVYRKWILWSVLSRTLILIFTSFLENFA